MKLYTKLSQETLTYQTQLLESVKSAAYEKEEKLEVRRKVDEGAKGKFKDKLKCHKCSYSTKSESTLKNHVAKKHKTESVVIVDKSLPSVSEIPTNLPTLCRRNFDGCLNYVDIYCCK